MDKLQEAAEQWALRHAAVIQEEIAIKAYLAGANSKEEAIQELVSALERNNETLRGEGYDDYVAKNDSLIQKHKQ